MKLKLIILLLALLLVSPTMAAQDHLAFMGIPLTGTIDQFQKKLTAKGYQLDASNKISGTRAFTGKCWGETVKFYVFYNSTNKIVCRAKIIITCRNKNVLDVKYNKLELMLDKDFPSNPKYSFIDDNGHKAQTIHVLSKNRKQIGDINLWVDSSDSSKYTIYVDYLDIDYLNELN